MPIRSVFFGVGETIVDESREYGTWADRLGVPRHVLDTSLAHPMGESARGSKGGVCPWGDAPTDLLAARAAGALAVAAGWGHYSPEASADVILTIPDQMGDLLPAAEW